MVPKPFESRLLTNMENMNINCESWKYSLGPALFSLDKESKLKLSVEARNHGDVVIVHCQGRIVYRDEAAALSRVVGEVLGNDRQCGHRRTGAAANLGAGPERGTEMCRPEHGSPNAVRTDQSGFRPRRASYSRLRAGIVPRDERLTLLV
jgi:hypothetical protein